MRRTWWATLNSSGALVTTAHGILQLCDVKLSDGFVLLPGERAVRVRISVVPDKPKRKGRKPCKT